MKKQKKPKPFSVGLVRVRAIRSHEQKGWYFRAERYVGGKKIPVWAGWSTDVTDVAGEVFEAVKAGALADAPVKSDGALDTVGKILAAWQYAEELRMKAGIIKELSYKTRANSVRRLMPHVKSWPAASVTHAKQQQLLHELLARFAPATVKLHLTNFRVAMRWAHTNGHVDQGPPPMPRFKAPGVRDKYTPSREEALMVRPKLTDWHRVYFDVLYSTGCRPGAVAATRLADIDRSNGMIFLRGKSNPRWVPLPSELIDHLLDLPASTNGTVWKTPWPNVRFGKRLTEVLRELGAHHWSMYGLRRLAVGRMIKAGVDIKTAARITGHSVEMMLKFYAQTTTKDMHAAVELAGLGDLYESQARTA